MKPVSIRLDDEVNSTFEEMAAAHGLKRTTLIGSVLTRVARRWQMQKAEKEIEIPSDVTGDELGLEFLMAAEGPKKP